MLPNLLTALALVTSQSAATKIDFKVSDGQFIVGLPNGQVKVPIAAPIETSPESLAFRRNSTWVVWDARGLVIRVGDKVWQTKLPDYAVTPKLFSRDQILKNIELFKSGERTREADGLSGAVRLGTDVFFLPRWTDRSGNTWLEALLRVDLTAATPKPELIGKFTTISPAYKPIDEMLFLVDDRLATVGRDGDTWGVSGYDTTAKKFGYSVMGTSLVSYTRGGYFLERSTYDTFVFGTVELRNATRRTLFEGVAQDVSLVPNAANLIHVRGATSFLKSTLTGEVFPIAKNVQIRGAGDYVIIWPMEGKAALLQTDRFRVVGQTAAPTARP